MGVSAKALVAWWRRANDVRATLGAVIFLAIGVGVAWFAKDEVGISGDAVLITVLLLPAVVYLAISGRLSEVSLPGGGGAKFRAAATTPVAINIEPTQGLVPVVKRATGELSDLKASLPDDRPIVLTVTQGNHFSKEALLEYLDVLSVKRGFKVVAILGSDTTAIGSMPAELFTTLLGSDTTAKDLVERLNDHDPQRIALIRGIVTTLVPVGTTASNALRTMTEERLDAALIVDSERRVVGVAERDQVLSEMLLAAAP